MSVTIIGLDIAQKTTGLAKFQQSPMRSCPAPVVNWSTVTAEKGKGFYDEQERAGKTLQGISTWISLTPHMKDSGEIMVVAEEFAFGIQIKTAKGNMPMPGARSVAMVTGIIRYWLWKNRIPFVLVSPTSLKKFIVGRGASPKAPIGKDIVIRELYARFGHSVDDNNAADAVGLAYIGAALKGIWTPQNEAQRDVLKKLKIEEPKRA